MTKQELLRTYDALMLCAENGKYGVNKEKVREWLEWAVYAYGIDKENQGFKCGREIERKIDRNI